MSVFLNGGSALYTTNVGKVQYHFDTLAFGEEYWYTPLREMAGTLSSRRTTATAGCAVSRHILGQAEPETAEQMAGSHGRSKIGRNSEYRPDRKYRPPVHPSGWCCAGPYRSHALGLNPRTRSFGRGCGYACLCRLGTRFQLHRGVGGGGWQ